MNREQVRLTEIVKHFSLVKLNQADDTDIKITTTDLNRIGLPLTGYLRDFAWERIQIVGNVEWGVIQTLDEETLKERFTAIMSRKVPCIVFARNLEVNPVILELGNKYGVPIYNSSYRTTSFIAALLKFVDSRLAKTTTVHGVLLDISGIGTLIMGKSGIGKSEIALELIKRGHRFVGDDAIEITKLSDDTLVGRAPVIIKNLLEIRGIGIVDISKLYGIGSVRESMSIDLVVRLDSWDQSYDYDRLGSKDTYYNVLNRDVPMVILPVSPGRNISVILEAAVRNQSLKKMGYDVLGELGQRMKEYNH